MKGIIQHLGEWSGRHPMDDMFLAKIEDRIREACQAVPTEVYDRIGAEKAIEKAARAAIVKAYQEEFPNAIKPLVVTNKWPFAECWIIEDEAIIKYSFSPETDNLMGGIACDPIRIVVRRSPPGLVKRMVSAFKRAKADEMAPVGTPDGKPELKLNRHVDQKQAFRGQTAQKTNAAKDVTRSTTSARTATPTKPVPTTPPKATVKR